MSYPQILSYIVLTACTVGIVFLIAFMVLSFIARLFDAAKSE